jgi:hypothetical protein
LLLEIAIRARCGLFLDRPTLLASIKIAAEPNVLVEILSRFDKYSTLFN